MATTYNNWTGMPELLLAMEISPRIIRQLCRCLNDSQYILTKFILDSFGKFTDDDLSQYIETGNHKIIAIAFMKTNTSCVSCYGNAPNNLINIEHNGDKTCSHKIHHGILSK